MGESNERVEWLKCTRSVSYFVHNYCHIYDATQSKWIPFHLWPAQINVLETFATDRLVIVLKARQLGLTWLTLCYMLWRALFHPVFTGLAFSRRETEARYLLSNERLKGIYNRIPDWMKVKKFLVNSSLQWQLSNGSVIYGFPTTAGDSYTAGFAFVDEADLVPDLDNLMTAVKPTIDGGGQMVLVSRIDKENPNSAYKNIYKAAVAGENGWTPIFIPWYARPGRTQEWYEEQKADILGRTGALDDLYEQYPATDEEALRPPELNKRFPTKWLDAVYQEMDPLDTQTTGIYLPGLRVYSLPKFRHEYVIGVDPAEGNPTSDDSVAIVTEYLTGEEVATLSGKFEPTMLCEYAAQLSRFFHYAPLLVERNNHGHAVINTLNTAPEYHDIQVLYGLDNRPGWFTTRKGKALMYGAAADSMRDHEAIIHDPTTYSQLQMIGGDKLEAPEGEMDDHAVAFGLCHVSIRLIGLFAEYGTSPTAGYRG